VAYFVPDVEDLEIITILIWQNLDGKKKDIKEQLSILSMEYIKK
jgi:hypothetical protein